MLQAEELAKLIKLIKSKAGFEKTGIISYTGFIYEDLLKKEEVQEYLEEIDLLIDGQYIKELDEGRAYIGSSNQRLIPISDRYLNEIETYYRMDLKRKIEMRVDNNEVVLIGVPDQGQKELWHTLKQMLGSG